MSMRWPSRVRESKDTMHGRNAGVKRRFSGDESRRRTLSRMSPRTVRESSASLFLLAFERQIEALIRLLSRVFHR